MTSDPTYARMLEAPIPAVNGSKIVVRLSWFIAGLALVTAGAGLLWRSNGDPVSFTTVRGQVAELYGSGLYRHDTVFVAAGQRGTDAVTLLLGIPLLVASTLSYRRGSQRGALLLIGTLGYFLYVYASMALGTVVYNELFLAYVVLFSASLFAFVLLFAGIDRAAMAARFSADMPRRGPAIFLFASALVTLFVWSTPVIDALIRGTAPARLDLYSTPVTTALDLAVITPAALLAGILVLRSRPLGYVLAMSLLVLEVMLAPLLAAQTGSQLWAGVTFPAGQIVGPIAGFATVALIAIWVLVVILRNVAEPMPADKTSDRANHHRPDAHSGGSVK
jgi:hypothetical protein